MQGEFLKRHLGFSLAEVVIAITILGIMAAAITLSSNVGKKTAKAEAEEIAARILRVTKIADRIRKGLTLGIGYNGEIQYIWDGKNKNKSDNWDLMISSDKFTYKWNKDGTTLDYSPEKNGFNEGRHMIITNKEDTDDKPHYIYFYEKGGRIRTTSDENE